MRLSRLAGGLLIVLALVPATALARDSQAPPGAGDRWLPAEGWVMFHWLPYDERQLFARLHMSRADVLAWMRDDQHHRLAQLARERGLAPARLAADLVDAWAADAGPARERVLVARALRTLTQGHLSQHVLFHYFHQPAIGFRARSIFGVTPLYYQWLRLRGTAPAAIALAHRKSRRSVASRAMRTLRAYALTGARRGLMPYSQARLWLGEERRHLSHWLDSRIAKPGMDRVRAPALAKLSGWHLMCRLFRGHQSGVATP